MRKTSSIRDRAGSPSPGHPPALIRNFSIASRLSRTKCEEVKYPTAKAGGFDDPVESLASSRPKDVDGCVVVPIDHQPAVRTAMRALLQGLGNELTTPAALLARVIGVHHHHVPPGAFSLGDTEGLELSPTSIQNGLVQARFRAGPIRHIGAFLLRVRLGAGALVMFVIFRSSKTRVPKRLTRARAAWCWKSFRWLRTADGLSPGPRRALAPWEPRFFRSLACCQRLMRFSPRP